MKDFKNIYIYIYIYIYSKKLALASALLLVMTNVESCRVNNFTGLHVGLGLNTSFEEYQADITVGRTTSSPIKTIKVMAEDDVASIKDNAADNFVNDLWRHNQSGEYVNDDYDKNLLWDGTNIVDGNGKMDNIPVHGKRTITIQRIGGTAKLYAGKYEHNGEKDVDAIYLIADPTISEDLSKHNLVINGKMSQLLIKELDHNSITYNITRYEFKETDQGLKLELGTPQQDVTKTFENGECIIGDNRTIKDFNPSSLIYYASRLGNRTLSLTTNGTSTGTAFYNDNDFQVTTDESGKIITKYEVLRGKDYVTYTPDENNIINIPASHIDVSNGNIATYMQQQSLIRKGTNYGWEMKLAYFHELTSNFMVGLDLTGTISSKNRKNVNISQFNINQPDLKLTGTENRDILTAKYNLETKLYETTAVADAKIINGEDLILQSTMSNDDFKSAASALNPGMIVTTDPIKNTYIDVTDKEKEVSFEKGIFNPRLAFVAGTSVANWFAGIRLGASYTVGKAKTSDMSLYKNVSISSPFIGLHVMKQVSNKLNLYLTADWNICDGFRSVDMNGIKNFKQNGYNIAAGVTWKVK